MRVSVHEAKTQLSRLLRRVMTGEEVVIERRGQAVARLVPIDQPRAARRFFVDEGVFEVPDDFDELPEDVVRSFEE